VFACTIQDIGAASKTNTPFQHTIQQLNQESFQQD
jgi:hypothetical protein